MYLGNGVLPQASFVTSMLQQIIGKVRVSHLIDANEMLAELLKMTPSIKYIAAPQGQIENVIVATFSDAAFNQSTGGGYGQTGLLSGLRIVMKDRTNYFHLFDWCSNKQRRASYSPYGAEILACADADDRWFYIKSSLRCLFPGTKIKNELFTGSKGLYETITTLHEGRDYRLRPTVQRMRNSLDSRELDYMRWIPGTINPADSLTKRNPNTFAMLNELVSTGIVCMDLGSGYALDSATWK